MKKADIEKLVGTDHEIRIQAPNSAYSSDAEFGQVIAVDKFQAKSSYHLSTQPIRDPIGTQRGGVHVRLERQKYFGSQKTRTVDEVVPYSHIHPETRAEYEARVARQREAREAHRREQDRINQERRERAKNVENAFQVLGISVYDNHNGNVSMSLSNAEKLLQRLGDNEEESS